MRSEIRNIQFLAKYGAFGNSEAMGFYVYGKRRDGRTVACKSEIQKDGSIQIYSEYAGSGQFAELDMTEFSETEWLSVKRLHGFAAKRACNAILDGRR